MLILAQAEHKTTAATSARQQVVRLCRELRRANEGEAAAKKDADHCRQEALRLDRELSTMWLGGTNHLKERVTGRKVEHLRQVVGLQKEL